MQHFVFDLKACITKAPAKQSTDRPAEAFFILISFPYAKGFSVG